MLVGLVLSRRQTVFRFIILSRARESRRLSLFIVGVAIDALYVALQCEVALVYNGPSNTLPSVCYLSPRRFYRANKIVIGFLSHARIEACSNRSFVSPNLVSVLKACQ